MKIGLALGGGGVRGLAHVAILEAMDDMGVKPSIIAGTSMGAVIGALYASGLSGNAIRELLRRSTISKSDTWRDVFNKRADILKWVRAVGLERGRGGFVNASRFLGHLLAQVHKTTFADLDIPLRVIAADYWRAEEVVLDEGPLLPALQARV